MKRSIREKNQWDPLVARLVEGKVKKKLLTHPFKRHEASLIRKKNSVSQDRRSNEEFEAYLKSLFDNDPFKIKYKNPDVWYFCSLKRKRNCR